MKRLTAILIASLALVGVSAAAAQADGGPKKPTGGCVGCRM